MNLEIADFFHITKIFISLLMMIFMILEFQRNKNKEFLILSIIFGFFLFKEITYILINIYGSFYTTTKNPITGEITRELANKNLFEFRFFIWHILEIIFVILVTYPFLFLIGSLKKNGNIPNFITLGINIAFVIGLVVVVLIFIDKPVSAIIGIGNNDTQVVFRNNIVSFIISSWWIYGLWKIALIIYAIIPVARIYGYTAQMLPHLYVSKIFYIISLSIFGLLYLFSSIVFIQATKGIGYGLMEIVGFVFLAVTAYKIFRADVMDMDFRIQDLEKEKSLIIELMREIGDTLSVELEMDKILSKIVDAAIEGTSSKAAAILLRDSTGETLSVRYVKGLFPPVKPIRVDQSVVLKESQIVDIFKSTKISIGETYIGLPASTGETLFIKDAEEDPRVLQTAKGIADIKSVIVTPLKIQDNIMGVLAVLNKSVGASHTQSDLSLIKTLADQAAITIRQFEMYKEIVEKKQAERDINIASEIQMNLLPRKFITSQRLDMFGFSIPAKGVGGDYFDYIKFGQDKLGIIIADVSGKGIPAALIMVMIRSITRTVSSLDKDANIVLSQLNNSLSGDIVEDRYATAFYCVLDAERRILNFSNAGHGPLLLYRSKSREFELLDTEGMPVGIMPGVDYGQDFVVLDKGDIGVLYTDGITEAMNNAHDLYGLDRLKEVIFKNHELSAKELCDKVLEDVNKFVAGAPQHDDETMIIFKVL
ncbi:MAG: SpoIIE family protein phosphatase [Spirochaetes bacterium]|nr:SpoIIE family protein phosphatase [Spirochaetota bacterium]